MSQWSRGAEAHAAMVLSVHLVNGGRTDILDGEDAAAISGRVLQYATDIVTVAVLRRHHGVYIYTSKLSLVVIFFV